MSLLTRALLSSVGGVLVSVAAGAQEISTESFDYPAGSLLNGQSGGTGWSGAWSAFPDWTIETALGSLNAFSPADTDFAFACRPIDVPLDLATLPNGELGVDGSSVYVYTFMDILGDAEAAGVVLGSQSGAALFFGKCPTSNTTCFIDATNTPAFLPGTDGSATNQLVIRIDFQPGPETISLWVNPEVLPPVQAPDLITTTGVDFTFRELCLLVQSADLVNNAVLFDGAFVLRADGGSGGGCLGETICNPAIVNSTGMSASVCATGSLAVADNDLTLTVTGVPDQPGLFFHSPNETSQPFGNGVLCIGNPFVRLDVVFAAGNQAESVVDTSAFSAGETRTFQFWFRDPAAGGANFNNSDAVRLTFE